MNPMTTFQLTTRATIDDVLRGMANADLSEINALIDQLIRLRAQRSPITLPDAEAKLLLKINQAFPPEQQKRYDDLTHQRQNGTITQETYPELLELTDEMELLNAKRIENLGKLAQLRGVSLDTVMKQLGLIRPAYEG